MKLRCTLALLVLVLGALATTSHGQEYRPSFDDPVFEEASYATVEIIAPDIEPSKVVAAQIEKPVIEVAIVDKALFEKSEMVLPTFIKPEFDNAPLKPVAPQSAPQKLAWVASSEPRKLQLMQPLAAAKNKVKTTEAPLRGKPMTAAQLIAANTR